MNKLTKSCLGIALALLIGLPAHAHGPTRQKVTETVTVKASPAAAWELIGDFYNMHAWHPAVESTHNIDADEKSRRKLVLGNGAELFEELKKHKDERMMYSYRIPMATHDVKVLPVSNYSSTLSVKPAPDGGAVITWKGAFYRGYMNNDPPPELNDETAVTAVTGVYTAGLENIRKILDGE